MPSYRHHFVSRLVLRGFSADGNNVVVVRRRAGQQHVFDCYPKVSIRKCGMTQSFNLVELPRGQPSEALEKAIARHVESPASLTRDAIFAAPLGPLRLDPMLRRAFCELAGVLHANSIPGRDRFDTVLDGIWSQFKAAPAAGRLITNMARAAAYDPTDTDEVNVWEAMFGFIRSSTQHEARENASKLTVLWGRTTANALEKMAVHIYRIASGPGFLLPDLPILGDAPGGGDIPSPGSWVMFPLDHLHLVIFSADGSGDEIRPARDARLARLFVRSKGPVPQRIQTGRDWEAMLSITSMRNETYGISVDDIRSAVKLADPNAAIYLHAKPHSPGILLA